MVEIPVLHHVAEANPARIGPRAQYAVSPDQLAAYLESREEWPSVSLGKEERGEGILLTFDDGYRSVLTEAVPLLERFGARAIVFVATGFVEGDAHPYELELAAAVEAHDRFRIGPTAPPTDASGTSVKADLYQDLRRPLKPKSHRDRERRLAQLAQLNGYDRSRFQDEPFLSWEEVSELDRHPLVTIGAHTHTHPVLTRRAPWTAYREMKTSKRRIEAVLGREVRHFSYPYGRHNFLVRRLACLAGFQWAFTTESKCPENISECAPMALPRPELQDLL
jgi:peptidoglycan/xylan/chitin deacetylase (PgdA/CDA1 family)